ncbi:hypothetical protein SAMN05421734_1135 [Pelagirhabdus alkalitolerans]|uniref:Uncharacterized protein n=1 Tax=Pelagirhabdus alkalitolerans TaxID=1612202 RepID=A0A1G6MYP7_9BACI|nr:hypothetical protein [Pelagirhabdus alkalitolerans]SDC60364.1 hypothetical protein SAMN05421734_1135 [Pelagirhabdus alkalitolerans]
MDNKQALGYLLLACKELGLTKEEVHKLRREMYVQFDLKDPEEAEKFGHEWYYHLPD